MEKFFQQYNATDLVDWMARADWSEMQCRGFMVDFKTVADYWSGSRPGLVWSDRTCSSCGPFPLSVFTAEHVLLIYTI